MRCIIVLSGFGAVYTLEPKKPSLRHAFRAAGQRIPAGFFPGQGLALPTKGKKAVSRIFPFAFPCIFLYDYRNNRTLLALIAKSAGIAGMQMHFAAYLHKEK